MDEIKCPCGLRHNMEEEDCAKTDCDICCPLAHPQTNADRIRAMSDEELAWFMAERNVNESTLIQLDKDHGLTAVQIEAIKHNVYCTYMRWLKQPSEE